MDKKEVMAWRMERWRKALTARIKHVVENKGVRANVEYVCFDEPVARPDRARKEGGE